MWSPNLLEKKNSQPVKADFRAGQKKVWLFLVAFFAVIFLLVGNFSFNNKKNNQSNLPVKNQPLVMGESVVQAESDVVDKSGELPYKYVYQPGPISMERMKKQGCVADGILSEYGNDTEAAVAMINRSNCQYLHRALETWALPPDFEKARKVMQQIQKPGIIYGMFLAEALKTNEDYYYADEDRNFDFSKMCHDGTENSYGEHVCKPDLDSKEYRKYLSYVTRQAMDLGIQSFLFGQIYYQDDDGFEQSKMRQIVDEMRSYAKLKGMEIAVGAQTGNITDERYLRMFDYIEGGVGMGDDGIVEDGPCWSHMQSCWALLWNDRYAAKANNVFLHLDWSGLKFDDMSVFARMDQPQRITTLRYLYEKFTSQNMGFMMPMMATINKENGGCYGPKKRFYSASNDYHCQDEDVINSLIK